MTPADNARLNAWLDSLVPVYNPDGKLPVTREEAGMLWMMENVRPDVLEWVFVQIAPHAPTAAIFYGGWAMDFLREVLGNPALNVDDAEMVNYRDNPTARNNAQQRMFEQMLLHMPKEPAMTLDRSELLHLASNLASACMSTTSTDASVSDALRAIVKYANQAGANKLDLTAGLNVLLQPIPRDCLSPDSTGKLVPNPTLFDRSLTPMPPGTRPHWWEQGRFHDYYNDANVAGSVVDNLYWQEVGIEKFARNEWTPEQWAQHARKIAELPVIKQRWAAELPASLAKIP